MLTARLALTSAVSGGPLPPEHPKCPQRSVSEATEEQQPGGGSEGLSGVGAEVLKGEAAIIVLPAAPWHQEGCGSTLGFVNWQQFHVPLWMLLGVIFLLVCDYRRAVPE